MNSPTNKWINDTVNTWLESQRRQQDEGSVTLKTLAEIKASKKKTQGHYFSSEGHAWIIANKLLIEILARQASDT